MVAIPVCMVITRPLRYDLFLVTNLNTAGRGLLFSLRITSYRTPTQ